METTNAHVAADHTPENVAETDNVAPDIADDSEVLEKAPFVVTANPDLTSTPEEPQVTDTKDNTETKAEDGENATETSSQLENKPLPDEQNNKSEEPELFPDETNDDTLVKGASPEESGLSAISVNEGDATDNGGNDGKGNNTNEVIPSATVEEKSDPPARNHLETSAAQTTSPITPIGQSVGAQILMNRFSTWRLTANKNAVSLLSEENAKQAQEYAQRMRLRFQQTIRPTTSKSTHSTIDKNEESETDEVKNENAETEKVVDVSPPVAAIASSNSVDGEAVVLETKESQDSKATISSANTGDQSTTIAVDDEGISEATSDGTSSTTPYTTERMKAVLTRASLAGSVMAESVATSFRGRYTADVATGSGNSDHAKEAANVQRKPVPESQIALILKSRVGEHMQEILNQLESHEFAILLGRGMLGVNLKQCYLKNHGIFVDYLVAGSQAEQTGLIRCGDLLVRLGDNDLRKGTIREVPGEIAKAKRPSVLVMATGTKVPLDRVNYVDVAVAMMHRARIHFQEHEGLSRTSSTTFMRADEMKHGPDEPPNAPQKDNAQEKEEKFEDSPHSVQNSVSLVTIPVHDSVEYFVSPPWPNLEIRKEFVEETPLRCLDDFVVPELADMLDLDRNFRAAIQNAFLSCALDSRKLPFLARHFSRENFEDKETAQEGSSPSKMTPSTELMLFSELASFLDLYDVTPSTRLRETASQIAYKFFLPSKVGSRLQPPLFDFHHIAPDSSLRHLEFVLSGKSEKIPIDLFLDFQKAVVESLTAAPFLSFLSSEDCSRMRAYLRGTAPFVNLPLKPMIDAVTTEVTKSAEDGVASSAQNCLAYVVLYLICRMEKESSGEHNFGLEDEVNRRLLGAPNDLCTSIFVKRNLLPSLSALKAKVGLLKEDETWPLPECEKLVRAVQQFWDSYIVDTLGLFNKSTEMESTYDKVRNVLESISKKAFERPAFDAVATARLILDSKLESEATCLANELLYEYAANVHTKFRDHKFHEWMCSELCKVIVSDPNWFQTQQIPILPQGCLKRMLRKVELPGGISSHKPYKVTPSNDMHRQYHNAEWAVVFGSSVGRELASQMPVPGLDSLDVRRYACHPVALDRDHDYDDFRAEEVLPATFESYAVVPPSKLKPFQSLVDADRVTGDGWEVSLVSFTMPKADSGSTVDATESALFGVSLCFQCAAADFQDENPTHLIPSEISGDDVECNGSSEDTWSSPLVFEKAKEDRPHHEYLRRIKISSELPAFSKRLKGQKWTERVLEDEHRDQTQPLLIGIALVSSRNVVFAMRETLSKLLLDFSRNPEQSEELSDSAPSCSALVELLGAFSYQDHEGNALRSLLKPYMCFATSSWIGRPVVDQEKAFENHALKLLTDCLPPIPLALLFVTVLLEQKVCLSSSRRSALHAASTGLAALLRPLKWSHLLVPLVPGALAEDLIQYPAPFILGVPSEDADNIDLLGRLPRDVTLVDLDVGRVILAPNFGQDNEMVRVTVDSAATARALRSQVLYLAQSLGTVFGNSLHPDSWLCDGLTNYNKPQLKSSSLDSLRSSVRSFVIELLEGTASCCFWIEESMQAFGSTAEPTVLFDEDKFFEIKNHRSTKAFKHLFPRESNPGALALNLEDFDLILESFLRCQNLSLYINTLPKKEMFYH